MPTQNCLYSPLKLRIKPCEHIYIKQKRTFLKVTRYIQIYALEGQVLFYC